MSRRLALVILVASLCTPAIAAQKEPGAVARILAIESTTPLRVALKINVGHGHGSA